MSDLATCENLRAEAARYHAEAEEIETGSKSLEAKPPEQNLIPSIRVIDVRFGSLADITLRQSHVRFTPERQIWNVRYGPKADIEAS
jgi:hypothetical protein